MAKDSESRRSWIKNVAIIFLVILLLLTFFSNTILNYSLPEVSAQYTKYATLSSAVKVSGTIKANESYNVVYEADQAEIENGTVQSRKVVSVFVREGDTVAKDAPILELQGGASTQLEALQDEYDKLKREYDLALLDDAKTDLESDKTLNDAKKAIADAREELAELKQEYNALLGGEDTTSIIETKIERLEEEIEDLTDQISTVSSKVSEIKGKISSAEGMIEEDIFSTLTTAEKLAAAENDYAVVEATYNELTEKVEYYKEYLENIKSSAGDVGEANTLTTQLRSLEDQLEELIKKKDRYVEDYIDNIYDTNSGIYELNSAYESASSEYYKYLNAHPYYESNLEDAEAYLSNTSEAYSEMLTLKNKIKSAETDLKNAEDALKDADKQLAAAQLANSQAQISGDSEKIKAAETALNSAQKIYDASVKEVEDCSLFLEAAETAFANAGGDTAVQNAKATNEEAQQEYDDMQAIAKKINSLKSAMDSAKYALDNAEEGFVAPDDETYERQLEDYDEQIEDLEDDIRDVKEKLDIIGMPEVDDVVDYAVDYDLAEAQKNYDNASADLTEVTAKYNTAKTNVESLRKQSAAEANITEYESLLATYEAELESLEAQLKQKNKEKDSAEKEKSNNTNSKTPDQVADQIKTTEDNIASLEAQLKITEATLNQSDTSTKFTREDQLKKLDELSAKIEAYQNAPETTSVTAPIAGRIVSVNYVPGDTVTSGNTVASIEIADKGYVCEITMSSDEARKIQVGAPCTVVNSWWYSNIEASVSQIRSDPSSQGKNRIVIIEVKGDVSENQSVTFSIGDKSQSYENVLPNSAIREDNDGKFVLVVEAKDSPLGTKYTARRRDIEVVASDDTQSAVSGLYGSEFVITNSNNPIADGQRVRLADNN